MEEDNTVRITLRLPADLQAKLEAEAKRTSKSQNAEIIARLERSFAIPDPDLAFLTAKFEADMARSDLQTIIHRLRVAELSHTIQAMAKRLHEAGGDFNGDQVSEELKAAQVALRDALDGMVEASEAVHRVAVAQDRLRARFEAARSAIKDGRPGQHQPTR